MSINRRSFLIGSSKVAASGLVVSVIPLPVEADVQEYGIIYDFATKQITIPAVHPRLSISELYDKLRDEWDKPENMTWDMPASRITSEIIQMENGWTFTGPSVERINSGGLTQEVDGVLEVYNSTLTIGSVEGYDAQIIDQGVIESTDNILKIDGYSSLSI